MDFKGFVLLFHGEQRGNGLFDRATFANNQHCLTKQTSVMGQAPGQEVKKGDWVL